MSKIRALSEPFYNALKNDDGLLYPLLERVKQDHTLMLAIRDSYINIYYRGGSILKLTEKDKKSYKPFFDKKYNVYDKPVPVDELPDTIDNREHVIKWIDAFPYLKDIMDSFFSKNSKPEREFQQLVKRSTLIC